jgi:hypothetical protein
MPGRRRGTFVAIRFALMFAGVVALGSGVYGCRRPSAPIVDEAKKAGKFKEDFPPDSTDYFAQMDQAVTVEGGGLTPLPLTPAEVRGRNTWMLWAGGNERFWDWLADYNPGFIDLLKLVDFAPQNRWPRFERAGLIVEPETLTPPMPDRYGLFIRKSTSDARQPDESVFGRSSGIVGLRLFPNPKFDEAAAKRWDANRYRNDPSFYLDPTLVRPYRVGMSCAFCHVGPHPLNPPRDVEAPDWSNLSATIGNQYLRTRAVFGNLLKPDNFYYHLLDSQLPGTLDTSLIPSDNINNANAQNAVFELRGRLARSGIFLSRDDAYREEQGYGVNPPEDAEPMASKWPVLFYGPGNDYGTRRPAPRFLIDGSDSVGPWAALARVYLNIGTYSERWEALHNPLFGFSRAKPFTMDYASRDSVYWAATEALMDDLARYLVKASSPMRLKDAPGAVLSEENGVPWAAEYARGREVFAARCIVCHSSKQPPVFDKTPAANVLALLDDGDYHQWALNEVNTREFWKDNYLSTDRRLPVTLVKTNAARALGSNGLGGQMWQDFSSSTYKSLPSVGNIRVWNPFTGADGNMKMPGGGRGYYRPASLVSLWATAPFLHNNSVGNFTNDPSVKGRIGAFDDGINKLLAAGADDEAAAATRRSMGSHLNGSSDARIQEDHGVVWRLLHPASLQIPAKQLPVLVKRILDVPVALLWALPVILFAAAVAVLLGSRWSRRIAGTLLVVLAFTTVLIVAELAGYLVDVSVRLPAGLPVDVVANLDFDTLRGEKWWGFQRVLKVARLLSEIEALPPSERQSPADKRAEKRIVAELGETLAEVSRNRDHVMDRGHYFGAQMDKDDREALIALLRTF